MKILGKILVDKMPENCEQCGFYEMNAGINCCMFNGKEIKDVRYSKPPKSCKLTLKPQDIYVIYDELDMDIIGVSLKKQKAIKFINKKFDKDYLKFAGVSVNKSELL